MAHSFVNEDAAQKVNPVHLLFHACQQSDKGSLVVADVSKVKVGSIATSDTPQCVQPKGQQAASKHSICAVMAYGVTSP